MKNEIVMDETLVCGAQVQYDASGVGHCWRDIEASDIPSDVRMEIESEIIDGEREHGYIVSGGLSYRW